MNKFITRPYMSSDKNFIYASWLKGLYHGNDWFNEIPTNVFFKNYQGALESILERPNVEILIACLPDDKEVILGYAVLEKNTIHWIFVKESWRKMGIAKELCSTWNITTCSHLTKVGKFLKKKYSLEFNPFIGANNARS